MSFLDEEEFAVPIDNFKRDYYFLSNFHPSYVMYEGDIYPTVEHAFQAAKIAERKSRQFFTTLPTPDLAKYHGRKVELRLDWEQIKDKVMYDILRDKFSRDPNKANLLATGNRPLIEGNNWHDNYWGVCSCERCKRKYNHGRNQLGKTLMQIRDELRKKDELWEE